MDVIDAIKGRRSINFFDPDREVPDETLYKLLELANLSPSTYNLQPWEVIAVTDPKKKAILRKCAFDQPKVTEASVMLIIIANPNAIEENIENVVRRMIELGYTKPEGEEAAKKMPYSLNGDKDSLQRKMFAVKNTAFFAMSIMLAARGLGLETHPMDGFSADKIKSEFNIPEDRIIPLLIAVGYLKPGIKLLPRAFRRDLDSFVKFNTFK